MNVLFILFGIYLSGVGSFATCSKCTTESVCQRIPADFSFIRNRFSPPSNDFCVVENCDVCLINSEVLNAGSKMTTKHEEGRDAFETSKDLTAPPNESEGNGKELPVETKAKEEQEQEVITVLDLQETEAYDIIEEGREEEKGDGEETQAQTASYTDKDFLSEDDVSEGGGSDEDMGQCANRFTSDQEMESEETNDIPSKRVKQTSPVPGSKKAIKYKQTTLNFAPAESASLQKARQETTDRKKKSPPKKSSSFQKDTATKPWKLRNRWSDSDTEKYRNGYPGKKDQPNLRDNVRFYKGQISSQPDGAYIDDIHKDWWGNMQLLERHHGYIQWLFPIREDGMNWQAQALQLHEAEAIKKDPKAHKRVLTSYELMLDFYGMKLLDPDTGELGRSKNWKECYHNLNWSSHNYLRITRILKSLGELGYEPLKKPFLTFIVREIFEHRELTKAFRSCHDYWIGTLKSDQERQEVFDLIDNYQT